MNEIYVFFVSLFCILGIYYELPRTLFDVFFDVYCRYTELPSGVLQIYDVQDSDKGAYSCSALNTFADAEGALPSSVLRHSKEAVLTVLNPTSGEVLKVLSAVLIIISY